MSSQHQYTLADRASREKDVYDERTRSSSELSSPVESQAFHSQWSIGWVTPSAIISCFLVAVALAAGHLGLFHWLDQRKVNDTIRQPYVTALSLVFANGFRTFLTAALGIAFIQMLWKDLRVRAMRVSDLDSFLSVLANPFYLGRFSLISQAPFPFLCALLCWLIPVAMIFPPGALTVEPKMLHTLYNQSVPTFDSSFTGNGTFHGMMDSAIWQADDFDAYSAPTNELSRIARQSILAGRYLTSPSPCGQNCSYTLEVNGPSFKCHDYASPDLLSWVNNTYPRTKDWPYLYIASTDSAARTNSSKYALDIQLQWSQDGEYHNLTCVAYDSVYTFNMTYHKGLQETATHVRQNGQLNASSLYFDNSVLPKDGGSEGVVNDTSVGANGGNIMDINRRSNLAAIHDSLALALAGYIDIFIMHNQQSANTIIDLSNLYSGPIRSPTFNITPSTMQDLLHNITLSTLTLNQTTTSALVTETILVNIYSFTNPARLITPYFIALAIALAFAIGGGHALVSNGISASTGGLLQTLCTTRGSDRLSDLAAKGCLGGRENVPEDLKNLKVMFGEIRSSSGMRIAGLGSEDEVTPLVRGSI
ncbi:hypothetical protein ASPWEDRAFT_46700 [Aspergillus wentii DTO 134E9]|uniref:Uncharacterized protein n=1 Tax=Aspergillus wentii DTO 134E9 TaxID=1073089 RepID=A0A1L9R501_ASPWE|nr:uncharacterized protein ASPWEDRAFT_46700 [Aspergillus wentii DTO 134E9]KAI9927244.1 hypothetical protein MW887_003631 [Aspergillus wentii]OJJ29972.1 hypothetical protein ASPWEDRAFT_46700 [Aspergillus wentii DTO 134E9]